MQVASMCSWGRKEPWPRERRGPSCLCFTWTKYGWSCMRVTCTLEVEISTNAFRRLELKLLCLPLFFVGKRPKDPGEAPRHVRRRRRCMPSVEPPQKEKPLWLLWRLCTAPTKQGEQYFVENMLLRRGPLNILSLPRLLLRRRNRLQGLKRPT